MRLKKEFTSVIERLNIKICLIIGLCLLFSGCNNKKYDLYVKELSKINTSINVCYDVSITYDFITDNEIMYQIVVDNPSVPMYNVEVFALHNKETKDIFPSLGIFDNKVNLIKDKVEEGYPKGIVLVGYIPYNGDINDFEAEFKISLSYENEEGKRIKTYYIMTL